MCNCNVYDFQGYVWGLIVQLDVLKINILSVCLFCIDNMLNYMVMVACIYFNTYSSPPRSSDSEKAEMNEV